MLWWMTAVMANPPPQVVFEPAKAVTVKQIQAAEAPGLVVGRCAAGKGAQKRSLDIRCTWNDGLTCQAVRDPEQPVSLDLSEEGCSVLTIRRGPKTERVTTCGCSHL